MKSIKNILLESTQSLVSCSDSARLDSEMLISYILDFTKEQLIINSDQIVSDSDYNKFLELVEKRKNNYPIAYLVGKKEFYGREFYIDENVLIPRPETEILVENAIEFSKDYSQIKILELGVGSGAISCSLALELIRDRKDFLIDAIDISLDAINIATKNIINFGLDRHLNIFQSTWFDNIISTYDLILSNPPYVDLADSNFSKEILFEPKQALYSDDSGLRDIKTIIKDLDKYLNPKGKFLCEIGYQQSKLLESYLSENYSFKNVTFIKDLSEIDRFLLIQN